jgi:putative membrane protein
MSELKGPVLIEMDKATTLTPATAPVVPEPDLPPPTGQALQSIASLATRRPSFLARLFWGAFLSLVLAVVSVMAWDFVIGLLGRNIWLGRVVLGLMGLFLFAALGLALREWFALARLARVDRLRHAIEALAASPEPALAAAQKLSDRVAGLYRGREDMRWALERLAERRGEQVDGDAVLHLSEQELMPPLDAAARREVEAAARQVAMVTAVVPLALADVVTALVANLRMIRRIAEIYGGRAGLFGSWRLLKTVMVHLVATGAVAIGDDLIGSVAGGGLLSKVSRRFGEGVVNGALTARVGVAAMDVCRPMPFRAQSRPKVTGLVKNALTGLFSKG